VPGMERGREPGAGVLGREGAACHARRLQTFLPSAVAVMHLRQPRSPLPQRCAALPERQKSAAKPQ